MDKRLSELSVCKRVPLSLVAMGKLSSRVFFFKSGYVISGTRDMGNYGWHRCEWVNEMVANPLQDMAAFIARDRM